MYERVHMVQRIILETDSVEVAAKLKGEGQDRSIYGPLVREIKSLFGNFEETLVRSVRRMANEAAHRMAKNGCCYIVIQILRRG